MHSSPTQTDSESNHSGPANPVQRNTLIGLAASAVLAGIKLLAGIFGHSSALVADAIESLADLVGSLMVWQALRISAKPASEQHPYGYGKAEAVAALAVGALLVLAAMGIVWKAFQEIMVAHEPPQPWTLAVLIAVIVTKETLFRVVLRGAMEFDSDAARADAWHHRSDAITSLAAFVGVAIAILGPGLFGLPQLVLADEVAAILASGVILLTAYHVMLPSLFELLDATSQDMAEQIRTIGRQVAGVVDIEKVHVRKSGPVYHADIHLHVDPESTVRVAHALSGKVKSELRRQLPALRGILMHVEPAETPNSRADRQAGDEPAGA